MVTSLTTRLTGTRSSTEPASHRFSGGGTGRLSRTAAWFVILAAASLIATPTLALDLFTLWRQPEVPLRLETGAWADYRSLSLSAGRRSEELVRIQCLGQSADGAWIFELLTLDEPAGGFDMTGTVGSPFVVVLPGNPATGFKWEVEHNPAAITLLKDEYVANAAALDGNGKFRFTFEPQRTGDITMIFRYQRPEDAEPTKAKR